MTAPTLAIEYHAAPACEGWWDCLASGEQVALVLGGMLCVTAIVVAVVVRRRR